MSKLKKVKAYLSNKNNNNNKKLVLSNLLRASLGRENKIKLISKNLNSVSLRKKIKARPEITSSTPNNLLPQPLKRMDLLTLIISTQCSKMT